MVFPSFAFQVETGLISQLSTVILIAFSIAINFWKKIVLYLCLILFLVFSVRSAFAYMAMPSSHPFYNTNQSYYGNPWVGQGAYFYPGLGFHSSYGPTPYYFRPHYQSPYRPQWMYNCPHCSGNQGWQQNYQPWWGPGDHSAPAS